MIHLPQTATPGREARVQGLEPHARDTVAAVREPPRMPDAGVRVRVAGPDPGASPRGGRSGFFRDPGALRALGGLLPSLFRGKGPDQAVRVWVAGCAAGEEAWTIALLLAEHAATLPHSPPWQLFATDTDAAGCGRGRDALYPASAVAGVPAARLGRFFAWEGGGYRVARPLRDAVLFARHDVLRDPPFTRLDLVVCRTLLPALAPGARARVVETFHRALRPGGVLFLGPDESPGDGGGFAPAAGAHPLYRRDAAPAPLPALAGAETLAHAAAGSTT